MKRYLRINEKDNVGVALADEGLKAGETVEVCGKKLTLLSDIARGHKFALEDIREGEEAVKYGYPIGVATKDIRAGEWAHTHNLRTELADDMQYEHHPIAAKAGGCQSDITIMGYPRKGGQMGIRNELWIIPTVGCVNAQAKLIADGLKQWLYKDEVDDVRAFSHNYGCSQLGDDHKNTRKALADLAMHPNAGGVLVLGLGCENNQISALKEEMKGYDPERVRFLVAQEVEDEVEEGIRLCKELLRKMLTDKREPMPISKLRVGLKCGGSDGLSGITANPLVGMFADWLVGQGGSVVLTEVPEMFGAETILMDRAENKEVFDKTVRLINDFKDYFRASGQPIYENPSPGNKAGGITTLEEKSLGCVQKGGTSAVVDVLRYGERIKKPGLSLLQAPGNDLVAASALGLSGCHMILFTTGRGTPFGTFAPTIKISTNTPLYEKKPRWIDYNAGDMIEGKTGEEALEGLIRVVVETADSELAKNEINESKELAIFKTGVTL
ncbi:MAG: altronate dehydratase family protein [Clostridium sp.]|nr:altronate dehydratase family protein [Clostridium sp.]